MTEAKNRVRIFLTENATADLGLMLKELKQNRGAKASPSDMVSWIIEFFFKHHYEKSRPEMVKSFMDIKKLVQASLKTATSQEELIHSLRDSLALAHVNRPSKKVTSNNETKYNKEDIKEK